MKWVGHMRDEYKILIGNPEGKVPHRGGVGVDHRIILRRILKECRVRG
jgi:hypothetical protein